MNNTQQYFSARGGFAYGESWYFFYKMLRKV